MKKLAMLMSACSIFGSTANAFAAGPDLKPIAARVVNGVVSVKNFGSVDIPAGTDFKITVVCNKVGMVGGCAEPPVAIPEYVDAAFPNAVTVKVVGGLAHGHVFNHKLKFWKSLVWASGSYQFTVTADAGVAPGAVVETDEGNNVGVATLTVP